jgi:hypothetical protein
MRLQIETGPQRGCYQRGENIAQGEVPSVGAAEAGFAEKRAASRFGGNLPIASVLAMRI